MSRGAHVIERVHWETTHVQVIDHYLPCPRCGFTIALIAARPWSLNCRKCKIQWQQNEEDELPRVSSETRMLMR